MIDVSDHPARSEDAPAPPAAPLPDNATLLEELRWRGLISQTTDPAALAAAFGSGPLTVYCGFDPTAPSLHFGNLVQLVLLRRLQRAGHRVICLVGGSTGLIGDPKPTSERVLKSKEQTADWVARITEQVRPFLDMDGDNPAVVVNNLDWTAPISALDFLRDIGKHFRVGTMLRKEAVAARFASDEGISYTEFSYQILQALDFLHLYREFGCTVQTGGQDQWGNLTAGVDLIHRVEGVAAHVLTTPLLTDSSGQKFGKSEGNAIWLSAEMTSPYAFYQYWRNVEDASVVALLKVFSDRSPEQLADIERVVAARPFARAAQQALAEEVTTLVHGRQATQAAIAASTALFGRGDLAELDEQTLSAALTEAGLVDVAAPIPDVAHLLQASGLCGSLSEARRTVGEGGAYLTNRRIVDPEASPADSDLLFGRYLVLRRGKRTVAGVRISR
jgi:tyrosyl-tRNA synthetase